MNDEAVDIYTDGACSGNPGPGGWGALLRYAGKEKELCGGDAAGTTNNRMELMAPIQALESLTRSMPVRLHTDSTYVRDGILKWLPRWKSNGWRTVAGQPVKNADLWRRLDAAVSRHQVQWFWVKGHAGHVENERADRLAAQGLREARGGAATSAPRSRRAAPSRAAATGTAATPAAGTSAIAPRQATGPRCAGPTKAGRPCPITARPSGLCHVHDPAVQCGAVKRNGQRCTVATGGGHCAAHLVAPATPPRPVP